jgi:hypothetical protein
MFTSQITVTKSIDSGVLFFSFAPPLEKIMSKCMKTNQPNMLLDTQRDDPFAVRKLGQRASSPHDPASKLSSVNNTYPPIHPKPS